MNYEHADIGNDLMAISVSVLAFSIFISLIQKLKSADTDTKHYFYFFGSLIIGLGIWTQTIIITLSRNPHFDNSTTSFTLTLFLTIIIIGALLYFHQTKGIKAIALYVLMGILITASNIVIITHVFQASNVPVNLWFIGTASIFASIGIFALLRDVREPNNFSSILLRALSSAIPIVVSSILSNVGVPSNLQSNAVLPTNFDIADIRTTLAIVVIVVLFSSYAILLSIGKLRPTLGIKIFGLVFGLLFAAIIGTSATIYQVIEKIKIEDYISFTTEAARNDYIFFENLNHKMADELLLMAKHQDVLNFMAHKSKSTNDELDVVNLFKSYMKSNHVIRQLRLIDGPESGKELIRVQRFGEELHMIAPNELQKKSNMEYYAHTVQKKAGEIYVSSINLNREGGKLQIPHVPTYRISTPLFNGEKKLTGILIINVDFNRVANSAYGKYNKKVTRYIVTENGDFLLHPDKNKEYGFEYGRQFVNEPFLQETIDNLKNRTGGFSESTPYLVNSKSKNKLMTAYKAYYVPGDYSRWIGFISVADTLVIEKDENHILLTFVQIGSFLTLIAGIFIYVLNRTVVKPIRHLKKAYVQFTHTRKSGIDRFVQNDEIGDLSKSFMELCQSVVEQESRLVARREYLNTILNNTTEGVIVIDENGIVDTVNKSAEKMFIRRKEDIIGRNISELLPSPHRANHDRYLENYIKTGQAKIINIGRELEVFRADNEKITIELSVSELLQGDKRFFVGNLKDITNAKKAELELKKRQLELSSILETAADGIFSVYENGNIKMANSSALKMLLLSSDHIHEKKIDDIILETSGYGSSIKRISFDNLGSELTARRSDGSTFPIELSISETEVDGRYLLTGVMRDISDRKNREEELRIALEQLQESKTLLLANNRELQDVSRTDPLTEIPNRRYFEEVYETEFRRSRRNNMAFGLLMIDVDHFKSYNDYYGHQQGDECLKTVARVIRETLRRPADFAARYGGEEFIVLIPDTGREGLIIVAESICQTLRTLTLPHEKSTTANIVTISVGVCLVTADVEIERADAIKQADFALYAAKQAGRNRVVFREAKHVS